ncbi:MAG TPA: DUF6006 family protein [Candidatus Thiothrix moscowensis]|uniref:DUF6006 family protein n=1 Tax=unclassified Thiothrix TaxID=2636184 RepID=UPI0025E6BCA8|nr:MULTISPECIES: DUF6006 family protein [unclassified Thiothrix]HRJ53760.1 DUF6006 family protein [Candidatus Thiothrix moscowensis]HRJ93842.1 DUF6006 family protein [Candidatus Thiothrix moscowensis]
MTIKTITGFAIHATLLGTLLVISSASYASSANLPDWINGEMNCKIDGRPAKMQWRVETRYETTCDTFGRNCSQAAYAVSIGSFSDNGGSWVPLESRGTGNGGNTFFIRYLGEQPNNWELSFIPAREIAQGHSVWRAGTYNVRYDLECWKGDKPLHERCNDYASHAVQQYQNAQRLFCAIPSDARWQDNHAAHQTWCVQSKGNPAWLDAENKARSDVIAQCRNSNTRRIIRHEVPR